MSALSFFKKFVSGFRELKMNKNPLSSKQSVSWVGFSRLYRQIRFPAGWNVHGKKWQFILNYCDIFVRALGYGVDNTYDVQIILTVFTEIERAYLLHTQLRTMKSTWTIVIFFPAAYKRINSVFFAYIFVDGGCCIIYRNVFWNPEGEIRNATWTLICYLTKKKLGHSPSPKFSYDLIWLHVWNQMVNHVRNHMPSYAIFPTGHIALLWFLLGEYTIPWGRSHTT